MHSKPYVYHEQPPLQLSALLSTTTTSQTVVLVTTLYPVVHFSVLLTMSVPHPQFIKPDGELLGWWLRIDNS